MMLLFNAAEGDIAKTKRKQTEKMNTEELQGKRIAVLLSGGVDSSVVVWRLVSMGFKPDCFYIKIGPEEKEEWDCSSEEDMEMATAVAARYGCRLGRRLP